MLSIPVDADRRRAATMAQRRDLTRRIRPVMPVVGESPIVQVEFEGRRDARHEQERIGVLVLLEASGQLRGQHVPPDDDRA